MLVANINMPLQKNNWLDVLIKWIALIIVACLATRPNSLVGVLLASVLVIPIFIFWLSFSYWWSRCFAGSKFMELLFFIILIAFFLGLKTYIIPLLVPYIGEHFY